MLLCIFYKQCSVRTAEFLSGPSQSDALLQTHVVYVFLRRSKKSFYFLVTCYKLPHWQEIPWCTWDMCSVSNSTRISWPLFLCSVSFHPANSFCILKAHSSSPRAVLWLRRLQTGFDLSAVRVGDVEEKVTLGQFTKFWKASVSFVIFLCPSVRMEQLGLQWMDFYQIWYSHIF